jgi:hypothetical protein
MLWGDRKSAWEPGALPDRRVRHWWDEQRLAGAWFAQYLRTGKAPDRPPKGLDVFWDGYLLFGPDAKWEDTPTRLVGAAGTVVGNLKELKQQLLPLLNV